VECEDNFIKKNLETKYLSTIEKALKNVLKTDTEIIFKVSKSKTQSTNNPDSLGPLFSRQRDVNEVYNEKREKSNLNIKFTFDSFVLGKNNNLAYAIATAIAEKPGELYNPVLFTQR